jgi:hypothetical protein
MHIFLFLFLLDLLLFFSSKVNNLHSWFSDFNKALSLFNDMQYASAQIIFEKVKLETNDEELKSDCAYYDANCAILSESS